jgi:cytochrome c-type biogenesis protein CcmH
MSEKKYAAAQAHWQRALSLVPADSEAARELQQALEQATALAEKQAAAPAAAPAAAFAASVVAGMGGPGTALAGDDRPLISGEVRLAPQLQAQLAPGAHLLIYALDEAGGRRPVAIWRGTPTAWPVRFALSDSMGMGAPPLLSSLAQVRLVARISKTGAAQRQADDWQVELPGVKTGVQGVVLDITRP